MARVDVSILKEIARIVQSRTKVPERVLIQKRTFLITYLDDHKQRIEEALRRHDPDRLNMLFGQLESKVKYQLIRRSAAAAKRQKPTPASASTRRAKGSGSRRQAAKSTATTKRSQANTSRKRVSKASRSTATAVSKKKVRKAAAKPPARKAAVRAKGARKRR